MDNKLKKTIICECKWFLPYFIIVGLISKFSATGNMVVQGEAYPRFFLDLFILHFLSWIFIYVIIRFIVWVVKK